MLVFSILQYIRTLKLGMAMLDKVDEYIHKNENWQAEIRLLRAIVLDCQLTEEFKWRGPCYTLNGKNIILLGRFKDYCVLSFVKGALLADPENILTQQTENSQSVRILKCTSVKQIEKLRSTIKAYIFEAIEVEKAGLKVAYKSTDEFQFPTELAEKMKQDHHFKMAFDKLTPGRQKGYLLYFSGAKQSQTRTARIEKYTERVLNGKGINDCVCGHSKRMPNCDGSHKNFD
jgi:uncharacterized protein YdeI (YjbR/CyaY-like superfamily)